MSEAYITGIGIVSPIGVGKQAFLEGVLEWRNGLVRLSVLNADEFRVGRGGEVETACVPDTAADLDLTRGIALALPAAFEAVADAGLTLAELPEETVVALGSGAGDMRAMEVSLGPPEAALDPDCIDPIQPPNEITSKLARRLGVYGRQITFINACAAGAQAIAVAADLVRDGKAEIAIAGGVETLSRMVMSGFEALRAVSPTGPRPFDAERDGIQLAELAAIVVLESTARVQQRNARPYARISGSGASADAFHVVRPDEAGTGAVLALRRALTDAGLSVTPLVAGLSVVHGMLPPHPAAMLAVTAYNADVGRTILYGILVGLPTAALAGPIFAVWISPRIVMPAENPMAAQLEGGSGDSAQDMPGFGISLFTVLVPVILIVLASAADLVLEPESGVRSAVHFIGNPIVALLLALLFSFWSLGRARHFTRAEVMKFCNDCLAPTATILLVIGAGGGFNSGARAERRGTRHRRRGNRLTRLPALPCLDRRGAHTRGDRIGDGGDDDRRGNRRADRGSDARDARRAVGACDGRGGAHAFTRQ